MTWSKEQLMPISRFWLWIAFVLGVLPVLLSARRVLLGVVVLSPVITLSLQQFLPRPMKWIKRALGLRFLLYAGISLASLLIYLHLL
jgi:hypothetical protein